MAKKRNFLTRDLYEATILMTAGAQFDTTKIEECPSCSFVFHDADVCENILRDYYGKTLSQNIFLWVSNHRILKARMRAALGGRS